MANSRICSIPDCGKPQLARGWCSAHYNRWRHHGDPLDGRAAPGEPTRHLKDTVLTYIGDDCLLWPFACCAGYGAVVLDGRLTLVSRVVCEVMHGPAPTPRHEAAHSCGKGHLGCVTPSHLSWKTPKENQSDRLAHGTHGRGERNSRAKLSAEQVRGIRALRGDYTQSQLSKMFGVTWRTVSAIQRRKTWAWLD